MSTPIRKVNMEEYLLNPKRYVLRSGHSAGAPACPFGNHYEWVGFDKEKQEYLRFTKSVFKLLIRQQELSS